MAVDYKKIGLVNTKEMFARAIKGGWAVPAFNFNNLEQLQAIIQASSELKSPVILQVSKGARKYATQLLSILYSTLCQVTEQSRVSILTSTLRYLEDNW